MSNLEVYHREFRIPAGADSEENLITLCTSLTARFIEVSSSASRPSACISFRSNHL